MNPGPLADRWNSRDYPVLLEVARRLDTDASLFDVRVLSDSTSLSKEELVAAAVALHPTYLQGTVGSAAGQGPFSYLVRGLTDRGRRATGLWPDDDSTADALVQLLERAADQVEDEEDQSALKRAGSLLRGVPAAVIADVTAALIRQQTGI